MTALHLQEVRGRAAAALAPVTDDDPNLVETVDSLEPPAVMPYWDDPWLTPATFGPCLWDASFAVLCFASRIEPEPGIQTLEALVAYVIGRLEADSYTWPAANLQAPRELEIGGIPLLVARVIYRIPVTLNGGPQP